MPVGKYGDSELNKFTSHKIDLQKGDIVYCTTDGFPDQFGGPKGKKLMYKKFERTQAMEIKPIKTKADYRAALKKIETLMAARAGFHSRR